MFGRPPELVAVNRIVLLPEFTCTVRVFVTQFGHAPVASNEVDCTVDPFTTTLAPRALVVPLANRTASVADPPAAALAVNCANAPVALRELQNPEPEKPAWSESIVPSQTAGEFSASNRTDCACAALNATNAPATANNPANPAATTALTLTSRDIPIPSFNEKLPGDGPTMGSPACRTATASAWRRVPCTPVAPATPSCCRAVVDVLGHGHDVRPVRGLPRPGAASELSGVGDPGVARGVRVIGRAPRDHPFGFATMGRNRRETHSTKPNVRKGLSWCQGGKHADMLQRRRATISDRVALCPD